MDTCGLHYTDEQNAHGLNGSCRIDPGFNVGGPRDGGRTSSGCFARPLTMRALLPTRNEGDTERLFPVRRLN